MVQNPELEEVVLTALYHRLKEHDLMLEIRSGGSEEVGRAFVRLGTQTAIDKPHKLRIHAGTVIGYGYDFRETDDEGVSARTLYERAVENTRNPPIPRNTETLVAEGIINDTFGWYVTGLQLPK